MSIKFECPFIACIEKGCECDVCSHSVMILTDESRIEFEDELFRKYLLWSSDEIDLERRMSGHSSYNEDDSDGIIWDTLTALLIYKGTFEEISLFDFRNINALLDIIHRYDTTYHLSKNIPRNFLINNMHRNTIYDFNLHCFVSASFARLMIEENKNKLFEKYLKNG